MAYEVTRVHLEMSVEDYDAFREWQTGKETAEETELRCIRKDLKSLSEAIVQGLCINLHTAFIKDDAKAILAYRIATESIDFLTNK